MKAVFSTGPVPRIYLEDNRRYRSQLKVQLWNFNQRATEAEESPLLRFVTRRRVVKTRQRISQCGELLQSKG
jgi:hypothetical protein